MAKIMLVEDDTNLSEIYQARLTAEGYDIVSAHDGEEALALAAKEKPDLIISDVMMPKISGFEMLDILRNTEGLKETKVIMLTALGQADDKSRAQGLGADRYLVKSQVTLEDIVKAAQELLGGDMSAAAPAPTAAADQPAPATLPALAPTPTPTPVAVPPVSQQSTPSIPVAAPPQAQAPASAVAPAPMPNVPVATPAPTPVPVALPTPPPQVPVTPPPASATAPTPVAVPATPPQLTQTVAAAPPPTTQPMAAVAPAPTDTVTAADSQLVSEAVEDLEKAAQPAIETTTTAPPTPETPANDASANVPPQVLKPKTDKDTSTNGGVAHKKVIQPIGDAVPPKPDLNTLLADEERKNPGSTASGPTITGNTQGQPAAAPSPRVPHQPGHIISPDAAAASPNAGGGIDPNSIAL